MRHDLYEQRIKELFPEAAGILMEKREEIIGDCRAVMEALADCSAIDSEMEAVSSEMEATAGLIQKLVDENATRKLDQHDYRKKYDGYAALESRMDSLKKSGKGKKSSMTFSADSSRGLAERRSCRWISMKSCSTGLWITRRSILMAGWYSLSATEWRSGRRFKAGSGRALGLRQMPRPLFLYVEIEYAMYGNL